MLHLTENIMESYQELFQFLAHELWQNAKYMALSETLANCLEMQSAKNKSLLPNVQVNLTRTCTEFQMNLCNFNLPAISFDGSATNKLHLPLALCFLLEYKSCSLFKEKEQGIVSNDWCHNLYSDYIC